MSPIQYSRRQHLGMNAGFIAGILATGSATAQDEFMTNLDALKSSLVRISDGDLIGIGFIGVQKGRQYIFTNTSVISGHNQLAFQTLEGKDVVPKSIELSATRDLARLMVSDETALTLNPEIRPDETVSVPSYMSDNLNSLVGVITDVKKDMIEIGTEFEKSCSGSPLLDNRSDVLGVANYLVYYKADGPDWVGTPRCFAYRLDDAEWYHARWVAYNKTYGKNLREIDEFRTVVYTVAQAWIERPRDEIELETGVGIEFDRWVKEYNGMLSDTTKSHSKGSRGEANEKLKRRFQESCQALGRICQDKADYLKFLCTDSTITNYLEIQFKWRAFELEKFSRFVKRHADRHRNDNWLR